MSDGIVPYQSSHLGGEQSELIIKGGHSIQTSPEAILELRRIYDYILSSRSLQNRIFVFRKPLLK